ncbi:MAG: DUF167 domain-containing protein [Myxococcota bacterium]
MSESPVRLSLKVVPGASSEGVAGWLEDTLKVRVRAPAERGKANAAVEELVAGALGIAVRRVRIVAGKTSARKTMQISGLSLTEVYSRLSKGR